MNAALHGPAYGPMPSVADPAQRQRLAAPALKAFFRLMASWQAPVAEAHGLLGVSRWRYYALKRRPEGEIGADTLHRIACLVAIHGALVALHGEAQALRWLRCPNTNRVFGGRTPLAYLAAGGVPALEATRRLLDAALART